MFVWRRRIGVSTVAAIAAALACGVAAAPAAAPGPPRNDNYLDSLELNAAGTVLDHVHTLADFKDTTSATVQTNLFDPCDVKGCPSGPPPPGPAEHTTCAKVNYGNTVWYDFYPDRNGAVRIRTSGYANVIALYTFSRSTLLPKDFPQRCAFDPNFFPATELVAQVKKGMSYTVQVGGANGASGQLKFEFDFFAAPPKRLTGDVTITAGPASGGLRINTVKVATARGATVTVRCGGRCNPKPKIHSATENFNLGGVFMPSGSKLQIFVTAPGSIGQLIQYTITPTGANKATFCLEPGSRKPRTKCH